MAEQEVVPQLTLDGEVNILDVLTAMGGSLNGAHINLFKVAFSPTPDSTLADFQAAVCDYTGYGAVALTWSPVGLSSDAGARVISNRAFFQATAATADNVAGGFWVDSPSVPTLALQYGTFGGGGINLETALAFAAITLTQAAEGPVTADVES